MEHKIKGKGRSGTEILTSPRLITKSSDKTVSPVNDGHSKGSERCRSYVLPRSCGSYMHKGGTGYGAETRRKKEKRYLFFYHILNICHNYECKHKIINLKIKKLK